MSGFFKKLEEAGAALRDKATSALDDGRQSHSQHAFLGRPPPLRPYWTANFSASTPVSQEWRHETGASGWGNNELQDYTTSDANAFFGQSWNGAGCLVIRAVVEDNKFTSARLTSRKCLERCRGYLQARIKAPSAKGIWPAFWLLPREPFSWPTDGEIDIMESWNDLKENHSCLHWGHFNGPDHDKHRVVDTHIPNLPDAEHTYGFAWDQKPDNSGTMVWYIDGRSIMKANIPAGTRRVEEFEIKLNIAMGGNVMQGVRPSPGVYEMVIHEIGYYEEPVGGWNKFETDCHQAPEGHMM